MSIFKNLVIDWFFVRYAVVSFILLGIVYTGALLFDWFYIFPHFDIPMHVFGGFLAGLIALSFSVRGMNPFQKLLWLLLVTLVAGIGVEVIEWAFDQYGNLEVVLQETTRDTYRRPLAAPLFLYMCYTPII